MLRILRDRSESRYKGIYRPDIPNAEKSLLKGAFSSILPLTALFFLSYFKETGRRRVCGAAPVSLFYLCSFRRHFTMTKWETKLSVGIPFPDIPGKVFDFHPVTTERIEIGEGHVSSRILRMGLIYVPGNGRTSGGAEKPTISS